MLDPATGRLLRGAAARVFRMAQMGGAQAVQEAGENAMLLKLAPLISQLEARLAASEALNLALIARLEKAVKMSGWGRR